MKSQAAAEGMLHRHNQYANTKFSLHPLLEHLSSERGQVVEEMAVSLPGRANPPTHKPLRPVRQTHIVSDRGRSPDQNLTRFYLT